MSRESRRHNLEIDLASLEARFSDALGAALQTCANGVWGLFGQNEHLERYSDASDDARRLLAMTAEIEALRKRLGYVEPNALCARYLAHRGPWTPKDLGEPRLAKQFLTEIEAGLLE